MTETFTNPEISDIKKEILTDDADDLANQEKHFYKLIAAELNLLQLLPKAETVQKILSYSKTKDNF